ncbi:MAG: TonB-dependent receptor, partial [Elusimicrobia bacterium]|nr:TonB-dependent receptor [Elusimicrobiota bacterium]
MNANSLRPLLLSTLLANVPAARASQETDEDLDPIVVTATRGPTDSDTGRSVTVLGPKRVRNTPAGTPEELLRGIPSVMMRRSDSRGNTPVNQKITLRGVGEDRTLVLADGVPLNDPFGGWILWHKVPRSRVSRIEVVRGAVSDLYGSLGMGGVVQYFTRSSVEQRNVLQSEYGGFDSAGFSLALSTRVGRAGAVVFGDAFETNGYHATVESTRGPIDQPVPFQSRNVGVKADWSLSDRAVLSASAQHYDSDQTDGTPMTFNRLRILDGSLGLDLATDAGSRWSARLFASRERLFRDSSRVNASRTAETPASFQKIPVSDVGASLVWWRPWGEAHTISAGLDARHTA